MKKILAAVMCAVILGGCTIGKTVTEPTNTPAPTPNGQEQQSTVRTMISATDTNPVEDDWTVLGEVGVIIGDEFMDVVLAADVQAGADGAITWDDAHQWALVAVGEENNYVLFDSYVDGNMYIDVATIDKKPEISLVHTSTIGLTVTKFTFADGTFYAEKLITPADKSNSIYNSFPRYEE